MATTTTITLKEFNLNKALSGAVLGFAKDGNISSGLEEYVLNFEKLSENIYVGYVDNVPYRFNPNGNCIDGLLKHKLFIVEAKIDNTRGTTGSRAPGEDDDGKVDINILQPREHFAMAALQGILHNISNPLSLDGASITLITTKAFEIAQGMMSAAADARAETSTEEPPESVDVDINSLTSTSDKILYNINGNLKALVDNGLKLQSEDPLDTYVVNMPNVPTEPVEITGSVTIEE